MLLVFVCGGLTLLVGLEAFEAPPPDGNATIRAKAGASEIVISTTNRVAGAIHSLIWNGKEFLDSSDHGRQLQSASSFECDKDGISETFNPTEAGSLADGAGDGSSSKLLRIRARGAELETTVQMAFWLQPGEVSQGHLARNQTVLSNHLVSKCVHIGHKSLPHVIEYTVTFTLPKGEKHTFAQFEALTGYMPAEFGRFWKYDASKLKPLDDGPGEQGLPVVLATESGTHAMGVYSPDQPSRGYEMAGYGRFRFPPQRVNKWNCVFRLREPKGLKPGDYRYRMFVLVGNLEDVRTTLDALHKEFKRP